MYDRPTIINAVQGAYREVVCLKPLELGKTYMVPAELAEVLTAGRAVEILGAPPAEAIEQMVFGNVLDANGQPIVSALGPGGGNGSPFP